MAFDESVRSNPPSEEGIPRRFGRLWLLRRIGQGGMGQVYLAATAGIEGAERPCVVKIIRPDRATDSSFIARFLDEARVQAQLQHPGIAQVLEASTDDGGQPYVVVEYIEGRSLGEVRAAAMFGPGTIGWADAVAIAASVAEALGHVHERTDAAGRPLGIVHRDVSPHNLMVSYGGDIKLIDFGTARAENRRCRTISGVVFAKPGYVAPELANGSRADHRVDLYALGIILWELLAGKRFLQGIPSEHLALVAKNELQPAPIAEVSGAPLELDAIICQLAAHGLPDRYTSARQAASDLAKLLIKADALPNGERGLRARIAHLMQTLYPAEPSRSRAEFAALVRATRWAASEPDQEAPVSSARAKSRWGHAPSGAFLRSSPAAEPKRSDETAGDLGPGAVLAGTRYRILRVLGRGTTGIVYEAEHVDLLRRVALKVTSEGEGAWSGFAHALRREAQAIARVQHPNLVVIHDFGQAADGRTYCAIELLDGETLEQCMARERRLDWREAAAIGVMVCRGLEAAHAAGLVHRDLKPANLFLSRVPPRDTGRVRKTEWEVKILDFGIATSSAEPWALSDPPGGFRVVGTPEYMAPEQGGPREVDRRADIYALGGVLYELCTGRLPYAARSPASLVQLKSQAPPEPMRDRARVLGLPPSLDRAVMKALAPKPADRFASAAEFRVALEASLALPRRRRLVARAVGYAALALAVGFALLSMGKVGATPHGERRIDRLAAPLERSR